MLRFSSHMATAAAAFLLCFSLTGCPPGRTFEIWLFNASNVGEMVLITIEGVDNVGESTGESLSVTISVPPNTAQIIPDIDAEPFLGDEIRIGVRGKYGTLEDRTAVVDKMIELEADATLPIVVTGTSAISLVAKYLPLSEAAKGLLQMRKDISGFASAP